MKLCEKFFVAVIGIAILSSRLACRVASDTFSGPLCSKDSRNYGQFERFHKSCRLVSLRERRVRKEFHRRARKLGSLSGLSAPAIRIDG